MTRYLLDLGHRDIGFIKGHPNHIATHDRFRGFCDALTEAGIDCDAAPVEQGYFSYRSGLTAGERLLSRPAVPTAIFASNDDMAAATVSVAHRRGLEVPEDLSIVGFDDTSVARFASPPLTTVRQPLREIGGAALRRALALAAGEKVDSYHVELATELVVRHSTAPPAPR
jgi:LacI family transcriptional regulator